MQRVRSSTGQRLNCFNPEATPFRPQTPEPRAQEGAAAPSFWASAYEGPFRAPSPFPSAHQMPLSFIYPAYEINRGLYLDPAPTSSHNVQRPKVPPKRLRRSTCSRMPQSEWEDLEYPQSFTDSQESYKSLDAPIYHRTDAAPLVPVSGLLPYFAPAPQHPVPSLNIVSIDEINELIGLSGAKGKVATIDQPPTLPGNPGLQDALLGRAFNGPLPADDIFGSDFGASSKAHTHSQQTAASRGAPNQTHPTETTLMTPPPGFAAQPPRMMGANPEFTFSGPRRSGYAASSSDESPHGHRGSMGPHLYGLQQHTQDSGVSHPQVRADYVSEKHVYPSFVPFPADPFPKINPFGPIQRPGGDRKSAPSASKANSEHPENSDASNGKHTPQRQGHRAGKESLASVGTPVTVLRINKHSQQSSLSGLSHAIAKAQQQLAAPAPSFLAGNAHAQQSPERDALHRNACTQQRDPLLVSPRSNGEVQPWSTTPVTSGENRRAQAYAPEFTGSSKTGCARQRYPKSDVFSGYIPPTATDLAATDDEVMRLIKLPISSTSTTAGSLAAFGLSENPRPLTPNQANGFDYSAILGGLWDDLNMGKKRNLV